MSPFVKTSRGNHNQPLGSFQEVLHNPFCRLKGIPDSLARLPLEKRESGTHPEARFQPPGWTVFPLFREGPIVPWHLRGRSPAEKARRTQSHALIQRDSLNVSVHSENIPCAMKRSGQSFPPPRVRRGSLMKAYRESS